jgi:hypothetical protein
MESVLENKIDKLKCPCVMNTLIHINLEGFTEMVVQIVV